MNANLGKGQLLESINAPAYPIAETSRLTGLAKWSVGRYLRGYQYYPGGEHTDVRRRPAVISQSLRDSAYASFLDLVDLLFVKEFLSRGFSLQYLRLALAEASRYLGTPHFARSEFYTSGAQIVLKLPRDSALVALMSGGQITIPEITKRLSNKLDFETSTQFGFAQRFYPKGKDGAIVVDPLVAFGRPTLAGYGVATSNIYDLYLGEKKYNSVSDWFGIPVAMIQAAVQFERSLWR